MKAPKEIYFSKFMTAFLWKERVMQTEIRCVGNEDDIKYLSEEYHNHIVEEITSMQRCSNKGFQSKIAELKVMLAEKDKRINELVELAKLGQNELYLIWSDYVDKPHAKYNSYYLFKADEILNKK